MKKGLGRGLDALFEDNITEDKEEGVTQLRVSQIEPDRNQPRKNFDEVKLEELAASLKNHGIIQPIIVRPIENGRYCIVAGERRWRAARIAEIKELPVVIRNYDERQISEISLIENLQREDLNPLEEASGYKNLMDTYHLTQEQTAEILGKSRPVIANSLRLLALPQPVLDLISSNKLSAGHARALLSLKDTSIIEKTAQKAANGDLTVRDIERLGNKKDTKSSKGVQLIIENGGLTELENRMKEYLGRKVKISCSNNKGKVEIEFYGNDDLDALTAFLSGEVDNI